MPERGESADVPLRRASARIRPRCRRRHVALLCCAALAGTPRGAAQAQALVAAGPVDHRNIELLAEMPLSELLETPVTVATGAELNLEQSPSVVSVISAEELKSMGVSSVAEALRMVPGFYDVYDQVTHNIGIRGISGGLRASGSIIKLMIDGQSVAYVGTTGNLFGPELVPLQAVERIEIIRGPGSAMYGANAFLGVINIITRAGADARGVALQGQSGVIEGNLAYGGSLMAGIGGEGGDALIAIQGAHLDRSGLTLPSTSPALYGSTPYGGDLTSRGDVARPVSVLVRARVGETDGAGQVSLLGSLQRLDAFGELNDLLPMTHRTRVTRNIETYRVDYKLDLLKDLRVQAFAALNRSRPGSDDLLSIGSPDFVLRSTSGATAWELGGQVEGRLFDAVDLKGGVDFRREVYSPFAWDQELTRDILDSSGAVFRAAGSRIPSTTGPRVEHTFRNVGVHAQAYTRLLDLFSLTAGLRLDSHNVYGLYWSPRAAVVLAPKEGAYFVKLLYGASFKAPSAEALYYEPAVRGDVIGDEPYHRDTTQYGGTDRNALSPQRAHSWEAAGGVRLGRVGHLQANVFATRVEGRVEYALTGPFFLPRNELEEWVVGGESELRVEPMDRLSAWLGLGVARSVARTPLESVGVLGRERQEQPLYPMFQAHTRLTYRIPFLELRLSPEMSLVSARARPQRDFRVGDVLPAYFLMNIALSRGWQWFGGRAASVSLRMSNVTDTSYAEPGYTGFDLPQLGRSMMGTVDFQL